MLLLPLLPACTPETCGPGKGRADDGNCYVLDLDGADSGDTDADADADVDADADTDTDTDTDDGPGPPIEVSGTFSFTEDPADDVVCAVSVWDPAWVDPESGLPDRANHNPQGLAAQVVTCPQIANTAETWSFTADVQGRTSVSFFGLIDMDGSQDTTTDTVERVSTVDPWTVEPGGTYAGIEFVLEPRPE